MSTQLRDKGMEFEEYRATMHRRVVNKEVTAEKGAYFIDVAKLVWGPAVEHEFDWRMTASLAYTECILQHRAGSDGLVYPGLRGERV